MDSRNWGALDSIVAEDISADLGTGPIGGRAAFVALVRSYLDSCGPTQHLLGNLVAQVQGERASSTCYVADLHLGRGAKADLTFRTLGEYHDRWQLRQGLWWLTERSKVNRAHIGTLAVFDSGSRS